MIDFSEQGHTFSIGYPLSSVAVLTGIVGDVYGMAQLGSSTASTTLSNKMLYPYFQRLSFLTSGYAGAIRASIVYYSQQAPSPRGWTDVAVLAKTEEFSTSLASNFIGAAEPELSIATYQQFLPGETDIYVELNEMKRSGARVFAAFVSFEWETVVVVANELELISEEYVWCVPNLVVDISFSKPETPALTQGVIGTLAYVPPDTEALKQAQRLWFAADPTVYPAAGTTLSAFHYISYDMVITAAKAIDSANRMGLLDNGQQISAEQWSSILRNTSYVGSSGPIRIDEAGDRYGVFQLVYYNAANKTWVRHALWDQTIDKYDNTGEVIWFSNTTTIPDLDIREPFHYWSCKDKDRKYDATGKAVTLETPDGSDVDNIDSTYQCDNFIDCRNLSDESSDGCTSNYLIVFIVFGIITGLLIFLAFFLIIFVLIFGVCLEYKRLRQASPFFLILILVSMIIGYSSIYAWFGKPDTVACIFQPWLLGLPAISMITALSVKTFRIYRIFRFPMKRLKISDLELLVLWCIVMAPALLIVIIWTIVSTPTARMEDRDGEDHYVCTTGGFTDEPGGLVFFFIFVAYSALVLIVGAIISFLARNVPSEFNETKLLTISIYNLGFLSVVIIPVFLVVNPFNPFIAWILRTVAILYAFTATMTLQFLPIIVGIFIVDKGKNVKQFKSRVTQTHTVASMQSRGSRMSHTTDDDDDSE